MDEIKTILSSEALLVMLMVPSMVTGLLVLIMCYRLVGALGKAFLDKIERTTAAFEKISTSVEYIKTASENQKTANEDVRITLRVVIEKLDRILTKYE